MTAEKKPRGEPPQDGSIGKTVLHAGQKGENLLKPTAWLALEEGYQRRGKRFLLRQWCQRTGPAGRLAARWC